MTAIADSSYIYALYSVHDSNHGQAQEFAAANQDEIHVPDIILPEVCYLFLRDLGYVGLRNFLFHFKEINAVLISLEREDLERVHEIADTYSTAAFDIVDCCIMAIAERLGITRIATFDRRDFSIFRPRHCSFFELIPSA